MPYRRYERSVPVVAPWRRPFVFVGQSIVEVSRVVWPTRASLRSHVVATMLAIATVAAVCTATATIAFR